MYAQSSADFSMTEETEGRVKSRGHFSDREMPLSNPNLAFSRDDLGFESLERILIKKASKESPGTPRERLGSASSESTLSMRSDWSKDLPHDFGNGPAPSDSGLGSLESILSMRSDRSKDKDPDFSLRPAPSNSGGNMDRDFSRYISQSVKLDDGPPARYQLKTKIINLDRLLDEDSKLRRFTVGRRDHKYPNKTILLVGATGSGKSTLINALVNFVMGVKFEDKVWFEIITDEKKKSQAQSQTSAVSVYEVFGFEGKTLPYSLTIIDTPGYGDTRIIEYDDIVTKKLQDLFCVPGGVKTINAVGLVLKATVNRLDARMAYIFNSVTSLFGKNMEQNIVALMTHSDGFTPTDALQALDEAKVKFAYDKKNKPVHFCFNNCQKKKTEDMRAERAERFAFETSEDGMKDLTEFLERCPFQSLQTTVELMKERIRLTACIQNLRALFIKLAQ